MIREMITAGLKFAPIMTLIIAPITALTVLTGSHRTYSPNAAPVLSANATFITKDDNSDFWRRFTMRRECPKLSRYIVEYRGHLWVGNLESGYIQVASDATTEDVQTLCPQ